jgi:hypothetical protein
LKAKPVGAALPTGEADSAPSKSQTAPSQPSAPAPTKATPVVVRAWEATAAPQKSAPVTSNTASQAAQTSAAKPASSSTTSPHGTRPATLYYSSSQRKETSTSPMKPTQASSTASSTSPSASANASARPATAAANPTQRPATAPSSSAAGASSTAAASAATRTAPATSIPRSSATADYRANVERQAREQRSVGNLLSYIVYGFIAVFVICAILAGFGAKTIFDRLRDQSATVAELDSHYAEANKELNAKLTVTQETLAEAQANITRQQDLIVKQQEELNRLIAAQTDLTDALKTEKANRASDTASLRARLKEVEARQAEIHTF